MLWLGRLRLLLSPAARRRRERDLEEEMQADLAMAREEGSAQEFGNLACAREASRAVWFPGWDRIAGDVRYAVRTLGRTPGFTSVAILSLALGIGSATALYSLVDAIVLKPLAYREPGRLMFIREVVPGLAHLYPTVPVNYQHFRFWREQAQSLESLAAISNGNATWTGGGEPTELGGAWVTANLFEQLRTGMQLGRAFAADEEQQGKNNVVILTDGLWRRSFAAAPDIVGRKMVLDGQPATVVGVLPAGFRFPKNSDLGPLSRLSERTEMFRPMGGYSPGWGGDYDYLVFGRLKADASPARAAAELDLLEKRIVEEHKASKGLHVQVSSLQDVVASPVRTSLGVLLAAVLVLVLIVCVNLANLLLARGSARTREFALRVALGASRGRLVRAALIETLLLSLTGGVLGVLAAGAAVAAFIRSARVEIPRLDEVHVDARAAAFGLGVSLLSAILFGLLPALRLAKSDPQDALRSGSHTMSGARQGLRLREWLVGGEVALSTLLLMLATLLTASLWRVLHVDRGFTAQRAVAARILLTESLYKTPESRQAFFQGVLERVRALPGVSAAALSNNLPLSGESNVNGIAADGSNNEALDPTSREPLIVNVRFVSTDYFSVLGIPLLKGRAFEPGDMNRNVVLVSERLAARLWPGKNPIGHTVETGSGVAKAEIIGVVSDVHTTRLDRDPTMILYSYWKRPQGRAELVARGAGDSAALMSAIRRTVWAFDSSVAIPKMRTMDEIVEQTVAARRFQMQVAAAFGISALLLAALGIYGVVAYGVALRRREIGIRLALGARPEEVRRIVMARGLRPVAMGLIVGLAAALAAGRLIRGLLFGVAPNDATTMAGVAAALLLVAALGCLLPARSATRLDPVHTLRED